MSVGIPNPMQVILDADLGGRFTANLTGIPNHYTLSIDTLPKIPVGIDPLEIKPLDLALRIKEFPSVRAHFPADFKIGLSLFGIEFLTVRMCGKAQAITEPFRPNPCEVCGTPDHFAGIGKAPTLRIGDE
jgi:hypothetical protein